MATIKYIGKKKGLRVNLPSGEISVKPKQEFKVVGDDLLHIKRVMSIERQQAEGMENHSFVLADEYEIAELEGVVPKEESDGVQEEGEKEEVTELSKAHIQTVRKLARGKGIEVKGLTKKQIIDLINNEEEQGDGNRN